MAKYMSDLTKRMKPIIAPLKKREEQRAIKAALAHIASAGSYNANQRIRVFGSELLVEKPPQRDALPERLIRILVADYTAKQIHAVTADSRGKVVSSKVLHGFQPAFHTDEVREARDIAERDERMAHAAGLSGIFAGAFVPHAAAETGDRLIGLHYLVATEDGGAKPIATVVVNLYEDKMTSFRDDSSIGDDKPTMRRQ